MPVVPGPDPSSGGGGAGPCEQYATAGALRACIGEDNITLDAAAAYVEEATSILWPLLGRTITGVCEATIFTDESCWPSHRWSTLDDLGPALGITPPYLAPEWRDTIPLQRPVVTITSVTVADVVLDPADYSIMDDAYLVRVDGDAWGNRVEITYSFGYPVPAYVTDACIELAVELWKDACNLSSCLPSNTTNVSRQGLSWSVDRQADAVRQSGPSLPKVTVAMSVANPTNQRLPSEVFSPDTPHRAHTFR